MDIKRSSGIIIIILCAIVYPYFLSGQPVESTKTHMFGFDVYQDYLKRNIWYYSPAEVVLKTSDSGSPAFILLQMRYTGTRLYGDKDSRGFLNILQLSIASEAMQSSTFDLIKNALGKNIELKPMPVSQFVSQLIIPLGDAATPNERYRKVGMSGVETSGESSSTGSFWQERTYTIRLDNYAAQLLWDQMEGGKLGLSFSYSFYSDLMRGQIGDIQSSGTMEEMSDVVEGLDEEMTFDSRIYQRPVKANTFPIHIESRDFSNCLKKVDVNEELPPAYAAFEVRCYDFTEDLRPDLVKKIVEIKAFSVAKEFISIKADFSRISKNFPSLIKRFPYAIRLDQPLEYRVTEINVNGEVNISPWVQVINWTDVIDVTTSGLLNHIGRSSLDFEVDIDSLQRYGMLEVQCEIRYQLNGIEIRQVLQWVPEDSMGIKSLQFSYDLNAPVEYRVIRRKEYNEKVVTPFHKIRSPDGYFFLSIQEN